MNRTSGSSRDPACSHLAERSALSRRVDCAVHRSRTTSWLGMTALLAALFAPGSISAQHQSAISISREVRDVFERSAKAVVRIHGVDEHSDIYGTGFFVDPTGTLYTSYTVGGEAGNFTVEFDGKQYPARQVIGDVRSGVAMLKIDAVTPTLPVCKTQQLEVATPVITIGFPLDLPETPSFGMIA